MTDKGSAEIVERQRVASDELGADLAERFRERHPGTDIETATGTILRYEAWALPRGNVVIEFPSRAVEAEFTTFAECQTHAAQLNEWLARRPSPDSRYRMFLPPPEPTEAALIEAVDRGCDVEYVLANAEAELAATVGSALAAAEVADQASAAIRADRLESARADTRRKLEERERSALAAVEHRVWLVVLDPSHTGVGGFEWRDTEQEAHDWGAACDLPLLGYLTVLVPPELGPAEVTVWLNGELEHFEAAFIEAAARGDGAPGSAEAFLEFPPAWPGENRLVLPPASE